MKEISTVFSFTFKEHLRKKGFMVSTIIILILTVALMLLPLLIDSATKADNNKTPPKAETNVGMVYVADNENLLGKDLSQLEKSFVGYKFVPKTDSIEALKNLVKNSDNIYLIEVKSASGVIAANYYYKQYFKGPSPESINTAIKNLYNTNLLDSIGAPAGISEKVLAPLQFESKGLGRNVLEGQVASIAILILLFFAIYYYGYWVAISVASEKTSRVMELLITSTSPKSIILGKTAAMGLLGLMQLSLVIVVGVLTNLLVYQKGAAILGNKITFSSFTPLSLVMIILYFILGYSLYAMMNAVAGATVSKAEDVNSAIMPISMIGIMSFYLGYMPSVISGGSKLSTIASMIPFSAPFSMPGRLLATDVPVWQICLSIALLILTIALFASVSVKLYSSAVLHYGKRLKLSDLVKMSKTSK